MKSSDPYRARVVSEINIHDALSAVEHFAELYPVERLSVHDAQRLRRAAETITRRVAARDFPTQPEPLTSDAEREHLADDAPEGYGHGV